MASRVIGRHGAPRQGIRRRTVRIFVEVVIGLAFCGIFFFKVFSYLNPSALSPSSVGHALSLAMHNSSAYIGNLPFLNSCPSGLAMQDIPGGYVCAPEQVTGVYSDIYRTYPLVGSGRESIYASTDEGSISAANDLLRNQYDVPRYPSLKLSGLPTWSENAYSANYWRFEFYSLRPSMNLLYAFEQTGNTAYAQKLVSLDMSFISAEAKSRWAWSDPHAVAFREMALVDTWWKLRQEHQLSEAESTAFLGEMEKTGFFLADPNHYQPENNHCVNEAAALYELGVAFPTLPNAQSWLALAKQRFQWQLNGLIDGDGQLIENSPYYDFYALAKYSEIYNYSVAQHSPITSNFKSKLDAMTHFATYILQPDSQVPLLGASIETTINDHGVYLPLAAMNSQLKYVLTHGAQGTQPSDDSVYFKASGFTVMRSGWQSGAEFPDGTFLTYNIGRYRTAHSDLDALGLTLYGGGGKLLPGPGLYTYTPGAYRNYFHGTQSENTVVVDGKSQAQGNGTGTPLETVDGLTYQSGESSLYYGVTHQRMVMMVDPDHILVVDRLSSASVHTYQQMFHLFPGAKLSQSGLTVSGTGGTPGRKVTIQQLMPQGITESAVINQRGAHPAGLCSEKYGQLLPCYQISYSARGKDAEFVTLITIGSAKTQTPAFSVTASATGQQLKITDGQRHDVVSMGQSAGKPVQAWATDATPPPVDTRPVLASSTPADWTSTGTADLHFGQAADRHNAVVTRLTTNSSSPSYLQNNAINLNLLQTNAEITLELNGYARLSEARLILSNDHWAKTETMNLLDAVPHTESDSWTTLFMGPSAKWGSNGGWRSSAPGFNWAQVDGLEIEIAARTSGGQPSTISVAGVSLLPEQNEGKLSVVFDDGYESILPAASYLHQNGMAATVGVIGKYVDYPARDHLNLYQLKQLQNDWGWDMANHTQQHADAVLSYYDQHNLDGYAADILQQAAWLEQNGLNSAPNWFIYPHGDTNAELEHVVRRYYMFARVTADNPDAYPYGDPHAISDLEIQYTGDKGEAGTAGSTLPPEVLSAIHQALTYHSTLILTFHRIHSVASDPPGYPLALFKQIVDEIKQSGIKVYTLSQLDESNGVPVTNQIHYQPAQPAQITVHIDGRGGSRPGGIWSRGTTWTAVALLLLLIVLGISLWWYFHRNGPAAQSAGAPIDPCTPQSVGAPARITDHYDRQVLSLKPVLYLPLANPSSDTEPDLSGNHHTAFYEFGTQQPAVAKLPNGDLAAVFNGAGDYVEVPSSPSLSITDTGCLTVTAWIRPDVLQFPHEEGSGYVYILGKGVSGKQEYALRMYSRANDETPPRPNRVSAYVFNLSGGEGSGAYFQGWMTPGEWIMATFVVDSRRSAAWPDGYIAIYKNGQRRGQRVSLSQFNVRPEASEAPFRIGTRDLESFFQGAIGKVAVYDSVLSDQQISATYEAMVSGN
jgi:hypothetical protein